jgi:hypothetical protein
MVLITSGVSTPGANTTTAELNTGDYQYAPRRGILTVVAKNSAAGINAQVSVGGVIVVNDQPVVFAGTTGTITVRDNVIASAGVNQGSKISFKLRNTTATAGTTCDYMLFFD